MNKNKGSIKKALVNKIILYVAAVLLIFILILMSKYKHKIIIYLLAFFSNVVILKIIKNNYISAKIIGLGKSRKALQKDILKKYFTKVLSTLSFVICICLIDLIIYGPVLIYSNVIMSYLLSLSLFTLPLNYLVNINQKRWLRILIIVTNLMIIFLAIMMYLNSHIFYLGYILLIIEIIILFILRNTGFLKKDI